MMDMAQTEILPSHKYTGHIDELVYSLYSAQFAPNSGD